MNKDFRYRKSKKGLISRAYWGLQRRSKGTDPRWINYTGMEILPKEEFIKWATDNKILNTLYEEWVKQDFNYRFTPSVDRLNPSFGYTLDNMDWCTVSENSKRMHQTNKVR